MESLIGKSLSGYEITNEIGRGGMAVVYKAYQPSLDRFVAIKILPPQLAFDTEFVRRFKAEARNAAKLKHPNIVTIHDVAEVDGNHFIVMEFLDGVTLKTLIERGGALPEARALNILAQIAGALDYAHTSGFVHRDVKPANIIIGANDLATLTDFGIAKAVEGTRLTRTGTLMGTPEYMSPEQARGEEVDYRTDIYSLGVVAYEMLGGRVPFGATTPHAVLHKIIYDPPPLLRSVNPRASLPMEQAITRALSKEPRARFASASEMVHAATAQPVSSLPLIPSAAASPTMFRPSKPVKSRSIGIALASAVVIGVVAIISIVLFAIASNRGTGSTITARPVNAVTITNAAPYTMSNLQTLQDGRSLVVRMQTVKTSKLLDVFIEAMNDNPGELSVFVLPYCDKQAFFGTARIEASKSARPVWIHAANEVIVNGDFCVSFQATPGAHVSIATNPSSQYLIRVAVSDE